MDDIEILKELKISKDNLIKAMEKDLNIEENYKLAKEKYDEYREIYFKITSKEPINTFESLINLKK